MMPHPGDRTRKQAQLEPLPRLDTALKERIDDANRFVVRRLAALSPNLLAWINDLVGLHRQIRDVNRVPLALLVAQFA